MKTLDPQTILHPHPVLIVGTYCDDGKPNIMCASWAGICCSKPPCVAVSLRKATLTYGNIVRRNAFTVGVPSAHYVKEADYVGIASGHDTDKFQETGLTPVDAGKVDAPFVEEFPFSLICTLVHHHELGLHTLFVGEILAIEARDEVLNDNDQPDIEKTDPFLWGSRGSNNYYRIGENIGRAFEIGKDLL